MLYLSIFTFQAKDRKAIIRRRSTSGERVPEGVKVIMEVVDLTKNRAFRLSQADDPKVIQEASEAWSDLARIETIPVVESDQILQKLIRLKKG